MSSTADVDGDRYFKNIYLFDRPAYNCLRNRVQSEPLTVQVDLLSHIVYLLELIAGDAAETLSVACTPKHLRMHHYQRDPDIHLYAGSAGAFGFVLNRLSQTLIKVKDRLHGASGSHELLRRLISITIPFRPVYESEHDGVYAEPEPNQDVRYHGQLGVMKVAEHCRLLSEKVLSICIAGAEQNRTLKAGQYSCNRLDTFLEGDIGIRVVHRNVMIRRLEERPRTVASDANEHLFIDAVKEAVNISSSSSLCECTNELLYGRAGLLHALITAYNKNPENAMLNDAIQSVALSLVRSGQRLSAERRSEWPLLYEFHGKRYLGAAHGLVGILYILLQVHFKDDRINNEVDQLASASISYMIHNLQTPIGNFPTRMGGDKRDKHDELIQWCHGAPGVIPLLIRYAPKTKECQMARLSAVQQSVDLLWRRGLLRKGVGLCHGIGGNGYAMLKAAESGMIPDCLTKAVAFAYIGWNHIRELIDVPDHRFSLFEGIAGFITFQLDLILALSNIKMIGIPGYDC